jgi:1,4-dihydroxy-2-naphthoyl-CoA synthase
MSVELDRLVQMARDRGHMGVVVFDQGGANGYVAACAGRNGAICDPRSYHTHDNADAALRDLEARLSAA